MLDLFAVCQRIPAYYSVFVTCLKLISNVLSVYQRTCYFFHTSAYVGAKRRSVTGPLNDKNYNMVDEGMPMGYGLVLGQAIG